MTHTLIRSVSVLSYQWLRVRVEIRCGSNKAVTPEYEDQNTPEGNTGMLFIRTGQNQLQVSVYNYVACTKHQMDKVKTEYLPGYL